MRRGETAAAWDGGGTAGEDDMNMYIYVPYIAYIYVPYTCIDVTCVFLYLFIH